MSANLPYDRLAGRRGGLELILRGFLEADFLL
jgi:hypothetical protein